MGKNRPGVGVACIVFNGPRILLGTRLKEPGKGRLQVSGGGLEMYEEWEACAARETREETGLRVRDFQFYTATNNPYPAHGRHDVTIWMTAHAVDPAELGEGVSEVERGKATDWGWHQFAALDLMQHRLFEGAEVLISTRLLWAYKNSLARVAGGV
jgi:8-oxo-dGTP diphosphatase